MIIALFSSYFHVLLQEEILSVAGYTGLDPDEKDLIIQQQRTELERLKSERGLSAGKRTSAASTSRFRLVVSPSRSRSRGRERKRSHHKGEFAVHAFAHVHCVV
jgi:hypothetical protein